MAVCSGLICRIFDARKVQGLDRLAFRGVCLHLHLHRRIHLLRRPVGCLCTCCFAGRRGIDCFFILTLGRRRWHRHWQASGRIGFVHRADRSTFKACSRLQGSMFTFQCLCWGPPSQMSAQTTRGVRHFITGKDFDGCPLESLAFE